MSNNNLTLDLRPKQDKSGNTFYVGKLKCPALIDASKGVVFLIFTSDQGNEQMQIAPMIEHDRDKNFDD
jgi:hypothetical protein